MSKLYFAAPLFNAAEIAFNERISRVFEKAGYEVFLPQRDGILAATLEGKTADEKTAMIFARDRGELEASDALIFVCDGRVPDEGACVELGLAYAMGKRCYGIRTDARSLEDGLVLNPMIAGCLTRVFSYPTADGLETALTEYLRDHSL